MSQKPGPSNSWIFSYALLSLQLLPTAAKTILLATIEAAPRQNIFNQLRLWLSPWESSDQYVFRDWWSTPRRANPALSLWAPNLRPYKFEGNSPWHTMLIFSEHSASDYRKSWEIFELLDESGGVHTHFQCEMGYPLTPNQLLRKFDTTWHFYTCLKISLFSFLSSPDNCLIPSVRDQF